MRAKLKVAVLTESRADYGIYYPLLKALEADERFDLQLLVTGMHLLYQHGLTADELVKEEMESFLYNGETLFAIGSDILFVLGDRRPMLEAAMDAALSS